MTIACQTKIASLKRNHSQQRFIKISALLAIIYLVFSWYTVLSVDQATTQIGYSEFLSRLQDLAASLVPYPLREDPKLETAVSWAYTLLQEHALEAVIFTAAIGLISAIFASAAAFSTIFLQSAIKLNTNKHSTSAFLVKAIYACIRGLLIISRAVPSLIWAYVFLPIFGPTYWTAIFALTLHNTGILGRIAHDITQNGRYPSLPALQNSGARFNSLVLTSIIPEIFSKLLIHFFYRWETCIRESVVVGMIGLPTLGYWIFQDAWPKFKYDEMMFYVLLCILLGLCIEAISFYTRRILQVNTARRC